MKKIILFYIVFILLFGCKIEEKKLFLDESDVTQIKVTAPLSDRKSEISSLAWYNDYLIILPQYPSRFPVGGYSSLFAISKKQLDNYLAGDMTKPIEPIQIPFNQKDMPSLSGFEGYEAMIFIGDDIYLAIETSPNEMLGYLVKGKISPDLSMITLTGEKTAIKPQSDIPNACYETLTTYNDKIIAIYEGNGKNVNLHPFALVFDKNLKKEGELPLPNIEYRITDATAVDNDKFYVINYFWPGDAQYYKPATDKIKQKWGIGKTHSENENVERILELKINSDNISLSETPPVYLKLLGNNTARNWEGIVRYKKGFILATDKYPQTIIAYVNKSD